MEKNKDVEPGRKPKEKEEKYSNVTVETEIVKKINSIDLVRTARIKTSDSLKSLSNSWNTTFFYFNVIAIVFVVSSLVVDSNKALVILTSIYTLYVILLQYFISVKNYDERSLRFHYHQLELENNILELKLLVDKMNHRELYPYRKSSLIREYSSIMEKYQLNLKDIENHNHADFKATVNEDKNDNNDNRNSMNQDRTFLIVNRWILFLALLAYIVILVQ